MLTGKHVQGQIAVMIVVAVIKTSLLVPVDRQIRGIDVQHDLLGWCVLRLQEHVYQQIINGIAPEGDLLVPVRQAIAQFHPAQCTLARQWVRAWLGFTG